MNFTLIYTGYSVSQFFPTVYSIIKLNMIEIILAVGLQTKHYVLLHNFNLTQYGLNYSRVPNKGSGRLLENEKKSHLYGLIQTYTFINFQQKVPPIRLFPPKESIPTYTFIKFCTFTVQFYYLLKLFYSPF